MINSRQLSIDTIRENISSPPRHWAIYVSSVTFAIQETLSGFSKICCYLKKKCSQINNSKEVCYGLMDGVERIDFYSIDIYQLQV
jgi:hypothetical protein